MEESPLDDPSVILGVLLVIVISGDSREILFFGKSFEINVLAIPQKEKDKKKKQ